MAGAAYLDRHRLASCSLPSVLSGTVPLYPLRLSGSVPHDQWLYVLAAPVLTPARFIAVAALVLGCTSSRPSDVLTEIQGTWGWAEGEFTCETNPHTIRLSEDARLLTFTYPHPIVEETGQKESVYEVLGHEDHVIRLFLRSETRRDSSGALVEWDLIMLSPDEYVWRQSDWPEDMSTRLLERCPASEFRDV